MSAKPFSSGWCRVRIRDGIGVMWVQPHPVSGSPSKWVIAGRTREACGSTSTAAFVMRADEFERDALIERIATPESSG